MEKFNQYSQYLANHYSSKANSRWFIATSSISVLSVLSGAPVVYVFSAKVADDAPKWFEISTGILGSVAIKLLLLRLSYNIIYRVTDKVRTGLSAEEKALAKPNYLRLTVIETFYWVMCFLAALPLMYLNDNYVTPGLDIPVIIAPMAAYRWSQENFYIGFIALINYLFKLKESSNSNNPKKALIKASLAELHKSTHTAEDAATLLNQIKELELTSILSPIYIEKRDNCEPPHPPKINKFNRALSLLGFLLGVVSVFVFFRIGEKAPGYFLDKYFNYNSEHVDNEIGKLVGSVTFYCHGTVTGWAAGMFLPIIVMNLTKVIRENCYPAQHLCANNIEMTNTGLQEPLLSEEGDNNEINTDEPPHDDPIPPKAPPAMALKWVLFSMTMAILGSLTRVGMYKEFENNIAFIVIAVLGSMGMNFMGFASIQKLKKEWYEPRERQLFAPWTRRS